MLYNNSLFERSKVSVLILDKAPVIGTIMPEQLQHANSGCVMVRVDLFTKYAGVGPIIEKWRADMQEREYDWQPRYYGYYPQTYDRNVSNQYKERRGDDGRTEVYAPCGLRTPPDGWLIRPYFDMDRFVGQMAIFAKGVKWVNRQDELAWMHLTEQYDIVPVDRYT